LASVVMIAWSRSLAVKIVDHMACAHQMASVFAKLVGQGVIARKLHTAQEVPACAEVVEHV